MPTSRTYTYPDTRYFNALPAQIDAAEEMTKTMTYLFRDHGGDTPLRRPPRQRNVDPMLRSDSYFTSERDPPAPADPAVSGQARKGGNAPTSACTQSRQSRL